MDRVCISTAKGDRQNDIAGLDEQVMGCAPGVLAIDPGKFKYVACAYDPKPQTHTLTTLSTTAQAVVGVGLAVQMDFNSRRWA